MTRNEKAHDRKHVNVGFDGATPKQVHIYDFREPVVGGGQPTATFSTLRETFQELSCKINTVKEHTSNSLARPQTSYQKHRKNSNPNSIPSEDKDTELQQQDGDNSPFSPTRGDHRPKTSRGKPHPSPDDFFNYVVPSPANARDGRSAVLEVADREEVVVFDEDGAFEQGYQVVDSNPISSPAVESGDRDAEERRRIRLLGCWLFGSALRM